MAWSISRQSSARSRRPILTDGWSSSRTRALATRPSVPARIVTIFGVAVESSTAMEPREGRRDAGADPSLVDLSARARGLIIDSIHHAGAGHIGGPLSATDLLVQ